MWNEDSQRGIAVGMKGKWEEKRKGENPISASHQKGLSEKKPHLWVMQYTTIIRITTFGCLSLDETAEVFMTYQLSKWQN